MDNGTMQSGWWGLLAMHVSLIQQRDSKISRTLRDVKKTNSEIVDSFMERQLTLLPAIDRETEKQVQKEVVKILKEYRALKTRFENEMELKHEGISLFPEIRDTRHVSNIKFKQIDKALQYVLDYDEAEIIKRKYLNADKPIDSFIYTELSMKKV